MTRKTEEKASTALQSAQQEIEEIRQQAFATLSRLPEEIAQLSEQRKRVREELREVLTKHLGELDNFPDRDEEVATYDYNELFPQTELVESEPEPESDELDDLDLDLSLPVEPDPGDEQDGDPATDLNEGDIAFRSGP